MSVTGGGGKIGAGHSEDLVSACGAYAAGDLDELAQPDDLSGFVVVGRDPQVVGEPQVAAARSSAASVNRIRGSAICITLPSS
jgi:hypothetical protein